MGPFMRDRMKDIKRNDLCPCGSGKKFKKCHMGRENELLPEGPDGITLEEMGDRIKNLPRVTYGRSREIIDSLDMKELTGQAVGITCLDLKTYADLNLVGSSYRKESEGKGGGGVFVNPLKTVKADPDHVYLAISPNIDDSCLIHELAHVLDYLAGSRQIPGTLEPVSFELGIPVDHLEHPEEFGYWLEFLKNMFDLGLDADDTIISYLYKNGLLLPGREIQGRNGLILRAKSDRILKFLSEHSTEIDALICHLPGYIGQRARKD
jgi:hypothetical protein